MSTSTRSTKQVGKLIGSLDEDEEVDDLTSDEESDFIVEEAYDEDECEEDDVNDGEDIKQEDMEDAYQVSRR